MLSLYFRLISARIRAQMQYKVSFCLELLGFFLITGIEFAVVAILLSKIPSLAGWSIAEIALLYGTTSLALGLAEMVGRGFDAPFELMMQRGTFDALLIRPLGTFFQVLVAEFQLRRLGRIFQAAAVLGYGLARLNLAWSADKLLLLLLAIVSGTLIYLGLMVIGATICFWTIKTPEVMHIFTVGGEMVSTYPLSIYSRPLRLVFLGLVPLSFANYPAALLLLGRSDPHGLPAWLAWFAPLVAALFLRLAIAFWRLGVSKYQSVGS